MAISDELSRLITAKAGIKSALEEKGLTIGDSSTLDEFPGLISEMEVGGVDGIDTSVLIDLIEGDLETLVIPEGTTKIGDYAFYYNSSLIDVSIPNSVTSIGNSAFCKCTGLKNFYIPKNVNSIQANSFSEAGSFNSDKFICDASISVIPEKMFYKATFKEITINSSIVEIGKQAYYQATGNSFNVSFNIPNSVNTIKEQAFYNIQTRQNNIIIPESVQVIEKGAFQQIIWDSMSIIILSKTDTIPQECFYRCKVKDIVFTKITPPNLGSNGINTTNSCPIYVPGQSVELYKNSEIAAWRNASSRIKPLAAIDYDASTYTVTASGRDNVELYIDASLINSSVYTFVPDSIDVSHNITVKSVDPSLGILDEVTQEVLVEGEEIDYSTQYFGLTAVQDASIGLTSSKDGGIDMKYSSDGENWTQWDYTNETLNLPAGETLYFKGDNSTGLSSSTVKNTRFTFQGENIKAHGNIQSLISDDDYLNNNTILGDFCFNGLFSGCTSLTTAPELPATTLADYCYNSMFSGCTSLTTAPELPATTLVTHCYDNMFSGCTSLVNAPELPATTLADYCYYEMFKNSTSLINAPELPATVLRSSCYFGMFNGCTSLTTAPELPATTIDYSSYEKMFLNCTSLNYIKAMFTKYQGYTKNWVSGVSSTGTFVMNAAAEWDPEDYRGVNGIPEGWTVEKVTA